MNSLSVPSWLHNPFKGNLNFPFAFAKRVFMSSCLYDEGPCGLLVSGLFSVNSPLDISACRGWQRWKERDHYRILAIRIPQAAS